MGSSAFNCSGFDSATLVNGECGSTSSTVPSTTVNTTAGQRRKVALSEARNITPLVARFLADLEEPEQKPLTRSELEIFRKYLAERLGIHDIPNTTKKDDKIIVLYLIQNEKAQVLFKEHIIKNIVAASVNERLDEEVAEPVNRNKRIGGEVLEACLHEDFPEIKYALDREIVISMYESGDLFEIFYADIISYVLKQLEQAPLSMHTGLRKHISAGSKACYERVKQRTIQRQAKIKKTEFKLQQLTRPSKRTERKKSEKTGRR